MKLIIFPDDGGGGPGGGGMLCLYTLKNPSTPERVFRAPCGVTCVSFHPKVSSESPLTDDPAPRCARDVLSVLLWPERLPTNLKQRVRVWVEADSEQLIELLCLP